MLERGEIFKPLKYQSDRAQNEAARYNDELARKAKVQAYEDLRTEFEDNLNKKLFAKNIARKVISLRMGDMINLEVRREKLRNMLSQEEEDLVSKAAKISKK